MSAQNGSVPSKRVPPISSRDLPLAFLLSALLPFAWLTSDRARHAVARTLSAGMSRFRPHARTPDGGDLFATFDAADRTAFARDVRTLWYYEIIQLLKLHAPGGSPATVSLAGRPFLDEAYSRGKGAILWIAPTTFGPMLTKAALSQARIPLWHLSRPSHGFSRSAFGMAVLNPIRIRAENRFLTDRIVILDGNTRRALEQVTDCLGQNRAVSITIGTEAKVLHTVPFMAGSMTVALRPIEIARQAGAALLPVVTLRDADGSFTATIGPPLLDDARTAEEAANALAGFLEPHARRYPEQFAQSSVFWPTAVKPSPTAPAVRPSR